MAKYDDNIVKAYINCEDIKVCSITELENDPDFMMLVMDMTKDKKIYKLCSTDVKVNKDFVMHTLDSFKDDKDFCKLVAQNYSYYLDILEYDKKKNVAALRATLANKMYQITGDNKYLSVLNSIYGGLRVKIEVEKRSADYNDKEDKLGYGFEYLSGMFGSEIEVLKYFATKMTAEILEGNFDKFNDMLHTYYVSFDNITDIDGDILKFIQTYDETLMKYLCGNIPTLKEGSAKTLDAVKKQWNLHDLSIEARQYDNILTSIHALSLSIRDAIFTEEALLVNLGYKYGIVDKIAKYALFEPKFVELLNEEFNDIYFNSIMEYSESDRKLYQGAENIIKKVLFNNEEELKKELK